MQVEARVESFYSHIPEDVVKKHTKPEWLALARFIEEKLAEDSYIIDSCDTKLRSLVVIDPVNRKGFIRLTKSELLQYDANSPTLISLDTISDTLEELNKIRQAKLFHCDVKPPSNLLYSQNQRVTLPFTDFGLSYSRDEIESSKPFKLPAYIAPHYPLAPPPTPRDPVE